MADLQQQISFTEDATSTSKGENEKQEGVVGAVVHAKYCADY